MSEAWRAAARPRRESAASAPRPWRARCWLIRRSIELTAPERAAWLRRAPPTGAGTAWTVAEGSDGTPTGAAEMSTALAGAVAGTAASDTPAKQQEEQAANRRVRAQESMRTP